MKRILQTLFLISLILFGSMLLVNAETLDWSDDFEDDNHDGWTVIYGQFEVDNFLLITSTDGAIGHPSTRTNGTWLFDNYENSTINGWHEFIFIANGTNLPYVDGYSIWINYEASTYRIAIRRWSDYVPLDLHVRTELAYYTFPTGFESIGWIHYNITRTLDGDIYLMRNGEVIVSAIYDDVEGFQFDSPINESAFSIFRGGIGVGLDNVYVGLDITAPEPTTVPETSTETDTSTNTSGTDTTTNSDPGLLLPDLQLMIAGAALVAVIIVVVIIKKR
ncbi:MAG: hypothetical protein ACTSUB_04785 [Candidatus Thorarchaeota archaeon]